MQEAEPREKSKEGISALTGVSSDSFGERIRTRYLKFMRKMTPSRATYIPTALLVARDIRLPPPFPLPRINIEKKAAGPVPRTTQGPEFG